MTDRETLLRAIIDQPEDDAPRLVMADWLEEQGDTERAEFIRMGCELAGKLADLNAEPSNKGGADPPEKLLRRIEKLKDREHELFRVNAADWLPKCLPGASFVLDHLTLKATIYWQAPEQLSISLAFRRGFVQRVECNLATWYVGKCPECKGQGVVGGRRGDRWGCMNCAGNGHMSGTGSGPAIVAAQPVAEVVLKDKRPVKIAGMELYTWSSANHRPAIAFWELPGELFELLLPDVACFSVRDNVIFKTRRYQTEGDAQAGLSRACVAWALGAAG